MLDIHPVWFLVQMGSFLVFLFLMNLILFKPFLKTITERDDLIQSALAAAKKADARRAEIVDAVDRDLKDAFVKSQEIIARARAAGMEEQKQMLDKAHAEADALTEKATAELAGATETARGKLRADVETIAAHIAKTLVGGRS